MLPTELFLSHSSADAKLAGRLAETLRTHRVPTWYNSTDVVGAKQWQREIGTALRRCDWFAVIISKSAIDSMWVRREVDFALNQRRFENFIIPILVEPCEVGDLNWVLPTLQIVSFQNEFEN